LGFKKLSVYCSIFYNIEQYTVHLSIHLVNDLGLQVGGIRGAWRLGGGMSGEDVGWAGVCSPKAAWISTNVWRISEVCDQQEQNWVERAQ
jgi:hypothetical protein